MVSMAPFDRFLFAFTIGSHIILVAMSISIILMLTILESLYVLRKKGQYSDLIHRLRKIFVISFGVGTASGIVMAIELVALFPGFMTVVSSTGAINLFYYEIFAFFLETVALVIYIYFEGSFKWKYTNLALSVTILVGTILSAVFITMVNAWMNTPNGFNIPQYLATGKITGVNPYAPLVTATTFSEILHVVSTTVFSGMMVWGTYFAYKYLRSRDSVKKALYSTMIRIASVVSIILIPIAGYTGSHEAGVAIINQPEKYAAFELNYLPGSNLPEKLFGTLVNGKVVGSFNIPGLQSFLAEFETGLKTLPGLSQFDSSTLPPLIVHTTFDIMVAGGLILGLFLFISFIVWVMKKDIMKYRSLLYLQLPAGVLAFVVYELGWVTAEVGRQPWIIYNVQTVADAANYSSGLLIPGYLIIAFYLILVPVTFYFFDRIFNSDAGGSHVKMPSSPERTGGGGRH